MNRSIIVQVLIALAAPETLDVSIHLFYHSDRHLGAAVVRMPSR